MAWGEARGPARGMERRATACGKILPMRSLSRATTPVVAVLVALLLTSCDRDGASVKPAAPAGQVMGPLEPSTNRQGRDISQAGMRMTSAVQCSALCAADPQCRAMSFATSDNGSGLCFLKSAVPAATESPAVVSAVKIASSPAAAP